jgi:ribosomal protein S13
MAFTPDQTAPGNGSNALGSRSRLIAAGCQHDFAGPNTQIADKIRQAADILAAQGADVFRVAAYRRASDSVRALDTDLGTIAERDGRAALEAIPGVGISIGSAIAEMLATGRWAFLDHLKGTASPESLFQSVPGIGPTLARRVCETLHVHTLKALETAAHGGRLEQVRGCAPLLPRCSRGYAAAPSTIMRNPGSICCWMSTGNTGIRRLPEN